MRVISLSLIVTLISFGMILGLKDHRWGTYAFVAAIILVAVGWLVQIA